MHSQKQTTKVGTRRSLLAKETQAKETGAEENAEKGAKVSAAEEVVVSDDSGSGSGSNLANATNENAEQKKLEEKYKKVAADQLRW
jgi:hypothetical protein